MKLYTTVMMCLWVASSTHAYEKDHLVYEVISEDEATVSVRANTEEFNETSLVVPDKIEIDGKTYTVTETPFMAFGRLESLVDIELPKTLKVLGQQTFFECDNLKEVYVHDGCVLEPFVFRASMKLEKVHLPEDLTVIPDGTFSYCRSLTDVNIPSALEQISWYAFSGCWKLKHITLPSTLKSLGKGAFKYCLALQEINVPESVTTLMPEAFGGCISLEKANIPDNITILDDALFDSCLVLKSIVIPENVTEIRTAAFRDCKALTQITIPQHVGFIYQEAFAGCNALQLIVSQPAVPPIICERTFLDYTVPLSVPDASAEAYSAARNWSRFMAQPLLLTIKDAASNHSVAVRVGQGQSMQLAISPADQWQIHSVIFNGTDITSRLSSLTSASPFTTPAINSPAELIITYEQRTSDIRQPQADNRAHITVLDNQIQVEGCDEAVAVYTLQGRLVTSRPTANGRVQFALPAGECYLVKAGGKTIKVLL